MFKIQKEGVFSPWIYVLVIDISVIAFCFVLRYSSFEIPRLGHLHLVQMYEFTQDFMLPFTATEFVRRGTRVSSEP